MTLRMCVSAGRFATSFGTASIILASLAMAQMAGGVRQADYQSPQADGQQVRSADFVDAYGNPAIVPAGFAAAYGGGVPCECGPCGSTGHGLGCGFENAFSGALPVDQCGPHYFDLAGEYVNYSRDESAGGIGGLTSLNIAGPVVLSGDSPDDEGAPGFRLMGRYDIGPLSVLEATYMAVYDLGGSATFVDPNPASSTQGNLFSVYTTFGTNPLGGGGQITEEAVRHSVDFDSDLQTAEIHYRRYWVGWSPRITGTMLAGFRYSRLSEDLAFTTVGAGTFSAITETDNDLAGFQGGGDMWVTLRQGLRVGSEVKGGIYHNRYETSNYFVGAALPSEYNSGSNVAFIGEAKLMMVADILPSLSVRGGYEVLFMDSLALAADNFNSANPFATGGRATAFFDSGEVTFHGWHVGLEYIW